MSDTSIATMEYRLSQWLQIIRDRNQSGLTIREYCEKNQLNQHSYYHYLKKIRIKALEESTDQKFVELPAVNKNSALPAVQESQPEKTQAPGLTIEVNGARIAVYGETPMELLARTLEVIKHAL